MDHNSIITLEDITGFSSISFRVVMNKTTTDTGEFWSVFGTRAPSGNWFYHSYGVVFYSDTAHVNRIALVLTDQTDTTKPVNVKNNYHITELASVPSDMQFGTSMDVYLKFDEKSITVYINNSLVTTFTISDENFHGFDGRIGFASKNVMARLEYAKVTRGDEIIFQDGFDADTLYVPTVQMKVEKTRE